MPRGDVAHVPATAARRGLHVGTFDYAQGWGRNGKVLEVRVNPRDIVSVPHRLRAQKLRCCRYRVVGVVERRTTSRSSTLDDFEWDNEDEVSSSGRARSSSTSPVILPSRPASCRGGGLGRSRGPASASA